MIVKLPWIIPAHVLPIMAVTSLAVGGVLGAVIGGARVALGKKRR